GAPLSETLRELVIHETMHVKTETLLMYAARVQHVADLIEPALARGAWVISDRFEDSTYAYQASAAGLGFAQLNSISKWALEGFKPDLTLLFDLPVATSLERIAGRRQMGDKFEAQPLEYIERVRKGFQRKAQQEPSRIKVIDSSLSEEEVWGLVLAQLEQFAERRGLFNG
ncbi:MAG: dTMP kinase, partial [Limnobacter sp.]|nr:dTMP kinase [Limnobacter sp.]